jgi:hypothetical protein
MSYLTWNYRSIPFFAEEKMAHDLVDYPFPAINTFQQEQVYPAALRAQLTDYVYNCYPLVATSIRRQRPYQGDFTFEFCYYTDGEIIFNNFLRDYIKQDDFAIPVLWLELIRKKNFQVDQFTIDYQAPGIFDTAKETFAVTPSIRKALTFK